MRFHLIDGVLSGFKKLVHENADSSGPTLKPKGFCQDIKLKAFFVNNLNKHGLLWDLNFLQFSYSEFGHFSLSISLSGIFGFYLTV